MQHQLTYFPTFSRFSPAQAQKLASNHTVDVSLCEVRTAISRGKHEEFQEFHTCSLSLRTINWTTPAFPTPSPEVEPQAPPPPACSSQRPLLWLHCSNTCFSRTCWRTRANIAGKTLWLWKSGLYETPIRRSECGSRLFAPTLHEWRWKESGMWQQNTLCGSLCSQAPSRRQQCFDYRDFFRVWIVFFFLVSAFPSQKLKGSLDRRTCSPLNAVGNRVEKTLVCHCFYVGLQLDASDVVAQEGALRFCIPQM